jgi:predicted ATPase
MSSLETTLVASGLALPEVVPLLAALLSLPLPAHYPALTLTPQRQRQKTLETLLAWLAAEARQQPVLVIVEDLHWIDPSTLELLSLLIDQVASARLCLVLTARPEFRPPWAMMAHLTTLTLRRFAPAQVTRLASQVAGDKALPPAVLEEVVRKTDGVPLFVEELTKVVLESGLLQEQEDGYSLAGPLPPLAIPATLHDALMARLDRLAAAKLVAQLGAIIGRTFTYDLVQAVAPLDAATLQGVLAQLVEAELVAQRGMPPQAVYTFKHALIQDTAYQSLLRSTRQQYHQRIAQVLEERFPETTATQPELLAHHYTAAGLSAQALPYWYQAGQYAVARSAYAEANQHLTTGLEVLAAVPETPARHQYELDLLTALAEVLGVTSGQAAPDLEPILTRATSLAQQVGEPQQHFAVLYALFLFHNVRAERQTAQAVAEQLLDLAQRQHAPALLLDAHQALGTASANVGAFVPARTHHEQVIALYDAQQHATPHAIPRVLGNHGVRSRALLTRILWELGYPDQAVQRSQEALTMAHALAHPSSLRDALRFSAHLYAFRREWQRAQAHAEALLALATEHGFARYVALGVFFRGWALAAQGQGAEGIAQMRQSMAAVRATGTAIGIGEIRVQLAEAYGQVGQVDEGLHLLAEASAMLHPTARGRYTAAGYLVHGELLLRQAVPDAPAAEACFQQALDVARHQQAKSWELRAAMSLSRLWQRQGKRAEAYELLAPIYGWFTEGFDTADLQDAKALLADLGHSPGDNRCEV